MSDLTVKLTNIKSLNNFQLTLPLNSGIYAFVGLNGSGKSAILAALSLVLYKQYPPILPYNKDSRIEFEYEGKVDQWKQSTGGWWRVKNKQISFNGMYEGSLFYGTRFNDSRSIDDLWTSGKITEDTIVPANEYIKEQLSIILHGEPKHYDNLWKLKNRETAKGLGIKNVPFFYKYEDNFISQYKMSSGECLLLSLLYFIYNALINKSIPEDQKILMLLDEIELALHPSAISRLFQLFKQLSQKYHNLAIYLTTHSSEVVKELLPSNIFLLQNNFSGGARQAITPCFPCYAIRSLYEHSGYDFVILVEDMLAKNIIDTIIREDKLSDSKLIKVIPAGGWENTLQLHKFLYESNALGNNTIIYSILDGDVKKDAAKRFTNLMKLFIPIPSIEKFLFSKLILEYDFNCYKIINDKYFNQQGINSIIATFKCKYPTYDEGANKPFYEMLIKALPADLSEQSFIQSLSVDILSFVDFSDFRKLLSRWLSDIPRKQ